MSDLDQYTLVTLQTNSGKYVSVRDGVPAHLVADADEAGERETFKMIKRGEFRVALLAFNAKYVVNLYDGTTPLEASGDSQSMAEVFIINPVEGDQASLQAFAGKFVAQAAEPDKPLHADQVELTGTAVFTIGYPGDAPVIQMGGAPDDRSPTPRAAPQPRAAQAQTGSGAGNVFTVSFCGTACTRDEGEVARAGSDPAIYAPATGYIPVRIHKEITGSLQAVSPSITVRGVGVNDWAGATTSEPLVLDGPLSGDRSLVDYSRPYSGGNQYSLAEQAAGWSMPALALHGANLAALSGASTINLIGHSRGAVEAIMAAWFLYAYGSTAVKNTPVNIFAIDPVPGPGDWYSIITQLAPNVARYVGVYAWDMAGLGSDHLLQPVVPRPNGRMTGGPNDVDIPSYWYWPWNPWKYCAYNSQRQDPLKPSQNRQPTDYELFACRGRHSTVAGNTTSDGAYDPADASDEVRPVPELVYRMARGYLTDWGVTFPQHSAVTDTALTLRRRLNTDHSLFDAMGGGATRTSMLPDRPYVRRITSIMGSNPFNTYFMDNVVGDPPYTMAYPVTNQREDAGWVRWTLL